MTASRSMTAVDEGTNERPGFMASRVRYVICPACAYGSASHDAGRALPRGARTVVARGQSASEPRGTGSAREEADARTKGRRRSATRGRSRQRTACTPAGRPGEDRPRRARTGLVDRRGARCQSPARSEHIVWAVVRGRSAIRADHSRTAGAARRNRFHMPL